MPRTLSRTRCSPLGEVSNDSTGAPQSAPGSTASPPTGASTRCALLADVLQSSGTSRESNHRNPTGLGEIHWLEPYPDALLDGAISVPLGPEARYEQTESISLAFVTALQILPPRQLAALILRDVLGFHANEVADMLDTTVESVKSALKRARAGMQRRLPVTTAREQPPASDSPTEDAIVAKFVSAYESADIDALVALLTDDAFMSMPPMQLEYQGRDSVARFFAFIFDSAQRFELVPTRANGQPAFGVYRHTPTGIHGAGLFVLALAGDRISAITRFENTVLPIFALPQSLPSAQ